MITKYGAQQLPFLLENWQTSGSTPLQVALDYEVMREASSAPCYTACLESRATTRVQCVLTDDDKTTVCKHGGLVLHEPYSAHHHGDVYV